MENMHTDVRVSKINHTLLTAPTRKLNISVVLNIRKKKTMC